MELHQYWVCQHARMAVETDNDVWTDKCNRVHFALGKISGIESCSTTSTPHSFRGDYAEVSLSCVVTSLTPIGALAGALPAFYAALEAGDLAEPDQWFETKINRLSQIPETKENTNG